MTVTREVFAELFGVHLPAEVPSAWVKGVCFVFVEGKAEIEELEHLCGGFARSRSPSHATEQGGCPYLIGGDGE